MTWKGLKGSGGQIGVSSSIPFGFLKGTKIVIVEGSQLLKGEHHCVSAFTSPPHLHPGHGLLQCVPDQSKSDSKESLPVLSFVFIISFPHMVP